MKTVFVGLSGGVDSALSAYLLKEAGYKVVGVFLKVWEPDFLPCTSGQDRLDAMRVAAHLEIPFLTYDLEAEYKKSVVDHFISEYKAGRTPNPDVLCNREIKFGAFWERAQKDGANFLATGHYARNIKTEGGYGMYRGIDDSKDQSYFVWTLTQDDLEHTLFPVGELPKREVRQLAKKINLPNAAKKDSQGLCFLGHVDMHEFLKHYIPVNKGKIKDVEGKILGEHDGVQFYTINQRVSVEAGEKLYVVGKNIESNEILVSKQEAMEASGSFAYRLQNINWIREEPNADNVYEAQIRYHGSKRPMTISGTTVTFEEPTLIAEGQSLVIYDSISDECMGGGIIESNVSPDTTSSNR